MPTFPAKLGSILLSGYAEQRRPAVLRTDMESGPPKQARIESRSLNVRSITYQFPSRTNYLTFISWVKNSTNNGASWFDWRDPVDGLLKQGRIREGDISNATPMPEHFDTWLVTFSLETWE